MANSETELTITITVKEARVMGLALEFFKNPEGFQERAGQRVVMERHSTDVDSVYGKLLPSLLG